MNNSARLTIALGLAALPSVLIATFALGFSARVHNHIGQSHGLLAQHRAATTAPKDASEPSKSDFYSEMEQVNERMHRAMAVAPTGGPDQDFVRMMIPHHQGAVDMALVFLKYGHDERLRRLAQAIIVEQGQEISYMDTFASPPKEGATARHDHH